MSGLEEYGGYIELDTFTLPMLHEEAIKLNCGRNALAYLLEAKNIRSLYMPDFLCSSCDNVLKKYQVNVHHYSICKDFKPEHLSLEQDDWFYVVNFYGQLSNEYISELKSIYPKLIIDNAQAYFQMPVLDVDTLYTCRKFFGVADGAVLYTDTQLKKDLPIDESFERMHFLLGRYERSASEFYSEYAANNRLFVDEPIKKMSKLTNNILHGVDYEKIKNCRTENFQHYHANFAEINKLELCIPEGAFSYPLWVENGYEIRDILKQQKIYIPTLWPSVFENCSDDMLEYDFAANILPLPCDQRYDYDDIEYISLCVQKHIKNINQ